MYIKASLCTDAGGGRAITISFPAHALLLLHAIGTYLFVLQHPARFARLATPRERPIADASIPQQLDGETGGKHGDLKVFGPRSQGDSDPDEDLGSRERSVQHNMYANISNRRNPPKQSIEHWVRGAALGAGSGYIGYR